MNPTAERYYESGRDVREAACGTKKIYYAKPSITDLEKRYVLDAAMNGWGDRCYEYIERFEEAFRVHLDVKYAIATSSCTGALHMGLAALGVGPGDEVILADINWIASVAPVTYLGAKPVLVDILPDTWCIDPAKIEKAITPRTKAIIAVHLYGNLCDMDRILEVAREHGLYVIEDAAEAIGSIYKGRRAGSMGDFGVFSFHGTKTITTGEGGMFVTNNRDLFEKVTVLSNHGRNPSEAAQFKPETTGFKYKMSNLQAALGCAQIERLGALVSRKRFIFQRYKDGLKRYPSIVMNPEKDNTVNGYWMPVVVVDRSVHFNREGLLKSFRAHNIDGRIFFRPLSSLPMFSKKPENFISYDVSPRAICLPSYHDMDEEEINRVIMTLEPYITGGGT